MVTRRDFYQISNASPIIRGVCYPKVDDEGCYPKVDDEEVLP